MSNQVVLFFHAQDRHPLAIASSSYHREDFYQPSDEIQWLQCCVLAFLDIVYFDNMLWEKERYPNPLIKLVVERYDLII